jgi:DNA-binding NtrC family response regulator
VRVRTISATNADLRAMIKAGTFREDLYYRLNVIELGVPPLAERREDVAPLAEHFLGGRARLTPSAQARSPPTTGRATCASSRTRCSARSCCAGTA